MVREEGCCQNQLSAKIRKKWCGLLVRSQPENWMDPDSNAIFEHSWLYFMLVKSKTLRTEKKLQCFAVESVGCLLNFRQNLLLQNLCLQSLKAESANALNFESWVFLMLLLM